MDFPGTRAVDAVTLEIFEGEVLAIVGANGSGKTTLLSVLCGLRRPTDGSLYDEDGPVSFRAPREALKRGITLVPQEPQLAGPLPCWENIILGERQNLEVILRQTKRREASEIVRGMLPGVDPSRAVATLRKGDRALLGLAVALRRKPRILALDEPTAVLGERSVEVVAAAIEQVRATRGAAILVSHRMRDVVELADRVVVLVDGRVTFEGAIAETSPESLVAKVAQGKMFTKREPAIMSAEQLDEPVVALEALEAITVEGGTPVNLQVHSGEIVGLAGLAGSGRSRLLRAVAGAATLHTGKIQVAGKSLGRGVRVARRAGILYIPEDRTAEAIFPPLSVAANITVSELVGFRRLFSLYSRRQLRELAKGLVRRFSIRIPHLFAPITSLSGGNQQRVVLARALARNPFVLVADEPTQGVDAMGRAAIHQMLRDYVAAGGAAIISISDFEELAELATRIIVIRDRAAIADEPARSFTYERLLALTTGAHLPIELPEIAPAAP